MQFVKTTIDNLFFQNRNPVTRTLEAKKLIATTKELCSWINTEFPNAHLTNVANEVNLVAQEAVKKAENIRSANLWLRLGIGLILGGTAIAFVHQLWVHPLKEVLHFIDMTKGVGMYAIAFIIFLATLEIRWKRRNCILAVHELRSLAHIIDMHQLSKDPVIEKFRRNSQEQFRNKVESYLHACIALLALVSKIGQLYIDYFPDPTATSAVNDFEETANGLAMKIWSKLINLQQAKTANLVSSAHCPWEPV